MEAQDVTMHHGEPPGAVGDPHVLREADLCWQVRKVQFPNSSETYTQKRHLAVGVAQHVGGRRPPVVEGPPASHPGSEATTR